MSSSPEGPAKEERAFLTSAVRWLATGLVFAGFNTAILYLLVTIMGMSVGIGTLCAVEANTLLRFLVNDRWVFGHRRPSWARLGQYHVANAAAMLVWWVATNVLTRRGLPYLIAGTAAIGCSTGVSFVSNFCWIWRQRRAPRGPATSVSGVVLLREDGAALLQLRDDKPEIMDPGIWVVPGGHSDPGETPRQAALREFEEETCYRCGNARPLAEFSAKDLGYPGDHSLFFFWDLYDGRQRIECREGAALRFVGRDEIGPLPRREYLDRVWDLALAARDACQE